jgi:phosphoribosylaminoimidazolecarboxamide formyltransferase/IMP cyclohydrolase
VERSAPAGSLARAQSVGTGAKDLSFNNLVDLDAAMDCVRDFEEPAAVVVKHASPCGLSVAPKLVDAYRQARDADALSAFGGVVALNREVDLPTADTLCETFIDCVIAPAFREDALEALRRKKTLRILATGAWLRRDHEALTYKRIGGGLVVQQRDGTGAGEVRKGKVMTKRVPTDEELAALEFAWVACKHVRSNAIVIARALGPTSFASVGLGGGQVSRVGAVANACQNAGDQAKGAVLASDAFFPFPDGLEAAAAAGVRAVVQPGGSKGDDKVIQAADDADIAMIFTGIRHFKH